jgi:phosphoserine aminotransferase
MRAYNFCAGPAALPTAVLEKAQAEMLDWQGKGLSIMEMSHRSKDYSTCLIHQPTNSYCVHHCHQSCH